MEASPDPHVDREVQLERTWLDETSWVDVGRGWMKGADEVLEHLLAEVRWSRGTLFHYDHTVDERRSGAGWRPGRPMPHPALAEATRLLQHRYGVRYPGFAMALYDGGREGQAFHRDTDMRWLEDTHIAVLTLGATRPWLLRPRSARHDHSLPAKGATHDLAPASGDLIVMGGRAQCDWEHSVPYLPSRPDLGTRVSVQWRHANRVGRPHLGGSYRDPRRYDRG